MPATKAPVYHHTQSLTRGLHVLRALNEAAGDATPREISDRTSLNRSTVKRLLETLAVEGYVEHGSAEGSYRLALDVLCLSSGLTEEARMLAVAAPALQALGQATGWSLRLTTARSGRMIVRSSTHPVSALAASASSVGLGRSLPMLMTAAGRAYLAAREDDARTAVLAAIRAAGGEDAPVARNPRLVDILTRRVHESGYALNDGDWGEAAIGGMAVPIRDRSGTAIGCLSAIYRRRATSRSDIEREFIPALRASAATIEAQL